MRERGGREREREREQYHMTTRTVTVKDVALYHSMTVYSDNVMMSLRTTPSLTQLAKLTQTRQRRAEWQLQCTIRILWN